MSEANFHSIAQILKSQKTLMAVEKILESVGFDLSNFDPSEAAVDLAKVSVALEASETLNTGLKGSLEARKDSLQACKSSEVRAIVLEKSNNWKAAHDARCDESSRNVDELIARMKAKYFHDGGYALGGMSQDGEGGQGGGSGNRGA